MLAESQNLNLRPDQGVFPLPYRLYGWMAPGCTLRLTQETDNRGYSASHVSLDLRRRFTRDRYRVSHALLKRYSVLSYHGSQPNDRELHLPQYFAKKMSLFTDIQMFQSWMDRKNKTFTTFELHGFTVRQVVALFIYPRIYPPDRRRHTYNRATTFTKEG